MQNSRKPVRTASLKSAIATAVALQCVAAFAQTEHQIVVIDKPVEFRQFDKVEITGSALRRTAESQALPVQVVTRDDIRRTGLRSTSEIVQSLSVMSNMVEAGQFFSSSGGFSNAAIHGMPNGTLVLVNGIRLSPYARQSIAGNERTGVDLDNIPVSAIDRIEVLTDGASSLYGTDALAGVVNIIMNAERKGVTISLDNTRPAGGSAQTQTFSFSAAGGTLASTGYHWRAELEHSERGSLFGSDRPSISKGYLPITVSGQNTAITYPLNSIYSSPATLVSPDYSRVWNLAWSPSVAQGQGCPQGWVDSQYNVCLSNPYPSLSLYPSQNKTALHLRGDALGENGRKYFAELIWGSNKQSAATYFTPTNRFVGPSSQAAAPYLSQAGMSQGALVYWSPSIANPIIDYDHSTWRASAGLTGTNREWSYQAQAHYGQSKSFWGYSRQLPIGLLGLKGSLPVTDGWFNPQTIAQLNAQLEQSVTSYAIDEAKTSVGGVLASSQRELWELDGGHVQIALGAELRRKSSYYKNSNDPMPQPDFNLHRHAAAVFAELRTPWQDNFESTASIRADQYDQFGSVNAKLSALWKFSPGWQMRGSLGSSFRAPQTAQLNDQRYLLTYSQVPISYKCPQAIASSLGATCAQGVGTIATYTQGGNLQPETSHQLTLGIRRDIGRQASLSADFWRVAMKNEIGQEPAFSVLLAPDAHQANFMRDTDGYLALFTPLRNLASSLKQGVDFDLRWRIPLDNGRLSMQSTLTRYITSWRDDGGGRQSDLGRISSLTFKPTPKYMARTMVAYNSANWSAGAIWSYRSAYADLQQPNIPSINVAAFSTLDLVGQYNPRQNIELRAGLHNVADKMPSTSVNSPTPLVPGIDTGYSNLWGRTLRVGATYRF